MGHLMTQGRAGLLPNGCGRRFRSRRGRPVLVALLVIAWLAAPAMAEQDAPQGAGGAVPDVAASTTRPASEREQLDLLRRLLSLKAPTPAPSSRAASGAAKVEAASTSASSAKSPLVKPKSAPLTPRKATAKSKPATAPKPKAKSAPKPRTPLKALAQPTLPSLQAPTH